MGARGNLSPAPKQTPTEKSQNIGDFWEKNFASPYLGLGKRLIFFTLQYCQALFQESPKKFWLIYTKNLK